jgi:class 3 adenylate cyclase
VHVVILGGLNVVQVIEQQSIWLEFYRKYNVVPTGVDGPQARVYTMVRFAGPLGIISHISFVFVFWALGVGPLALFNVFSVFIFSIGVWQSSRGNLTSFFVGAILLEVPVHAILATYYLGFESGFWLLVMITVSLVMLYPSFSRLVRFLVGFANIAVLSVVMAFAITNGPVADIPAALSMAFLVMNFSLLALVVMVMIASYDVAVEQAENALQLEFERAEALLLNVLPSDIATRLKANEEPLADEHGSVSVLFADIAGFTNLTRDLPANTLINLLNDLFTRFDGLAGRYKAEKIKTIGDAYMVAAGLRGEATHAEQLADLAIGMQRDFEAFREEHNLDLKLRIGIHSGGVIAGVIGKQKFSYDLWGDTVNIASRMESEGVADRIQISAETRVLLPSRFTTTSRGQIVIKGHHARECFLLESEKK